MDSIEQIAYTLRRESRLWAQWAETPSNLADAPVEMVHRMCEWLDDLADRIDGTRPPLRLIRGSKR